MSQNFVSPRTALRRIVLLTLAASLSTFAPAQANMEGMPPDTAVAPPMNGIAHIAIRVKDIAASVAFYHKLGFDQAFANMAKRWHHRHPVSFIKPSTTVSTSSYTLSPTATIRSNSFTFCFEGADLNATHDYYVGEGLTPIAVRTAGAGNLLFTMKGPQQFAEPQNIEYTQYMPGSKHTLEFGKLNGPDRVGDKMTVVALAMQDPAAARTLSYLTKLGFTPSAANPARLDLPGTSGESVEMRPRSRCPSARAPASSSLRRTSTKPPGNSPANRSSSNAPPPAPPTPKEKPTPST